MALVEIITELVHSSQLYSSMGQLINQIHLSPTILYCVSFGGVTPWAPGATRTLVAMSKPHSILSVRFEEAHFKTRVIYCHVTHLNTWLYGEKNNNNKVELILIN